MPVAFLKSGNNWLNRPDCSVEVVEATTMLWAKVAPARRRPAPNKAKERKTFITIFLKKKRSAYANNVEKILARRT
jgi:hypothetical protein